MKNFVRNSICKLFVFLFFVGVCAQSDNAFDSIRCIHTWVDSPPDVNSTATTQFFSENELSNFFANGISLPFNTANVAANKKIPFYRPTKNYCLYFKLDWAMHNETVYSNDIHDAVDLNLGYAFDFLTFHKSVANACVGMDSNGSDTGGIGYLKRSQYAITGTQRRKYVKVKWYCCQQCAQTIEQIEARFMIQLIYLNYYPKEANFVAPKEKNTEKSKELKKKLEKLRPRAVSPCVDIYGQTIQIATPNYDIPVCPVYALFDAASPHYKFNPHRTHSRISTSNMLHGCLWNTEATDNTCHWDFSNLTEPVEMKCCCHSDLRNCSRALSNQRTITRCFQFNGTILPNGTMESNEQYPKDAYAAATSNLCGVTMKLSQKWATDGIEVETGRADLDNKYMKICKQRLDNKKVDMQCFTFRNHKQLCPFEQNYTLADSHVHYCCCRQMDLCNLAIIKDKFEGLKEIAGVIQKEAENGQTDMAQFASRQCVANPDEYFFTKKGCVQYLMPDYTPISLLENHNFVVEDYVEFGKFSECFLLQITLKYRNTHGGDDSIDRCDAKSDVLSIKEILAAKAPMFVLQCKCSGSYCNYAAGSKALSSIDAKSPCFLHDPINESDIVNISATAYEFKEPAYCYVRLVNKNGKLVKTFGAVNQTQLVNNDPDDISITLRDEVYDQTCQMIGGSDETESETLCSCISKEDKPCNHVGVLNKALNMNYGQRRIEDAIEDESRECELDGEREECYAPGCFLIRERVDKEKNEFNKSTGCMHRHPGKENQDLYARRLCLLMDIVNDCRVVIPPSSDREAHIVCCCYGYQCKSPDFEKKMDARLVVLQNLMENDEFYLTEENSSKTEK